MIVLLTPVSNATTKPNYTSVNTEPYDGMGNAVHWESVLNACYAYSPNRTRLRLSLAVGASKYWVT